jgi:antitoxin CptB
LSDETRLKRVRLRSWRRGIKEMDLLLGPFADAHLGAMTSEELDLFEALLEESDQELYAWTTGRAAPPDRFDILLNRIAAYASNKFTQQSFVL